MWVKVPARQNIIFDAVINAYNMIGSWEEINLNTRSANFGFSNAEGFSSNAAYTNPVVAYNHKYVINIITIRF